MSSTTPYLGLTLYDATGDQAVTFATFRAIWGGPATTSNFYKIDTAYGALDTRITNLESFKGAISVNALFASANYYEVTGVTGITAYATGMTIVLSLDTTSNGTVTLNVNSLGTKSVMKVDSTGTAINLTGSDLVKGRQYLFKYDGTRWLWVSANSADQIQIVGTSGNVVTVGSTNNLLGTTTQAGLIADTTHAATAKTSLADNDEFSLIDSAASYILKRITFANLKTSLQALFTSSSGTIADDYLVRGDGGSRGIQSGGVVLNDSNQLSGVDKITLSGSNAAPVDINNTRTGGWAYTMRSVPAGNSQIGDSIDLGYNIKDSGSAELQGGLLRFSVLDPTSGSVDTKFSLHTKVAGGAISNEAFSVANGATIGSPTGSFKGIGTLNVAGDIYKNNTAYTNPDWVFELWKNGNVEKFKTRVPDKQNPELYKLETLEEYVSTNLRLPHITDDPSGMFERSDKSLEWIERLVIYAIESNKKITELEEKLVFLESKITPA